MCVQKNFGGGSSFPFNEDPDWDVLTLDWLTQRIEDARRELVLVAMN
jgi:hypothetical protein